MYTYGGSSILTPAPRFVAAWAERALADTLSDGNSATAEQAVDLLGQLLVHATAGDAWAADPKLLDALLLLGRTQLDHVLDSPAGERCSMSFAAAVEHAQKGRQQYRTRCCRTWLLPNSLSVVA